MNNRYSVILKNGKPFLRLAETKNLPALEMKIWKVNSDSPYVKAMGMILPLESWMITDLRKLLTM